MQTSSTAWAEALTVTASHGRGLVDPGDAAILLGGGLLAGAINTLAGGGSLLTVPLLVLLGLPGTVANGTNRIGVLAQNLTASWGFWAQGVQGIRQALPAIVPVAIGAVIGASIASSVPDDVFERAFAIVMVVLLVPILRGASGKPQRGPLPGWLHALLFFGIGLYGGAFQAGVGIFILFALSFGGTDLVTGNHVKVLLNACFTLLTIPIFAWNAQIDWGMGLVMAIGFAAGGLLGARIAVIGGERVIRPVLAVAVIALAARMLGLV